MNKQSLKKFLTQFTAVALVIAIVGFASLCQAFGFVSDFIDTHALMNSGSSSPDITQFAGVLNAAKVPLILLSISLGLLIALVVLCFLKKQNKAMNIIEVILALGIVALSLTAMIYFTNPYFYLAQRYMALNYNHTLLNTYIQSYMSAAVTVGVPLLVCAVGLVINSLLRKGERNEEIVEGK